MIAYQRNQLITIGFSLTNQAEYLVILHWIKDTLKNSPAVDQPIDDWSLSGYTLTSLVDVAKAYEQRLLAFDTQTSLYLDLSLTAKTVPSVSMSYREAAHRETLDSEDLLYLYYYFAALLRAETTDEGFESFVELIDNPSFFQDLLLAHRKRQPKLKNGFTYQRNPESGLTLSYAFESLDLLVSTLLMVGFKLDSLGALTDNSFNLDLQGMRAEDLAQQAAELESQLLTLKTSTHGTLAIKPSRRKQYARVDFTIPSAAEPFFSVLDYYYLYLAFAHELWNACEGVQPLFDSLIRLNLEELGLLESELLVD